jgi:predicted dehydrogenase
MNRDQHASRRDFLRHSARLAAAGLAMPAILPSGVLAFQGNPGANDRIGIGGIGVGRQGGADVRAASGKGDAKIVAVADANLPRAEKFAASLGAEAHQDYRELLDRKDIDAIITATPDHWRSLVCIHACQAEKDIYAEKPMTLTIREGRLMVQAVRKYGRVFQTGSQQRSMAANRLGCELIRNGRIGKIKMVIGNNYPSPWECALPGQTVPEGLDWEMWCGPNPLVPYHPDLYAPRANPGWISFRPYSGGEMTGWGAHGLDQIQWALGMDDSGPVEVWTEGGKFQPPTYQAPEGRTRGDRACSSPRVFFRYANDVVVKLDNGNPGGAIFVGEDGKMEIFRGRVTSNPEEVVKTPLTDSDLRLYRSDDHMQNWLDCIRNRKRPIADVEIGHRSSTVCHLGNLARLLGRRLQWDPVQERFVDDEQANALLDRPRRPGYEFPEI